MTEIVILKEMRTKYELLTRKYRRDKTKYRYLDLCVFTIPLLVLQACATLTTQVTSPERSKFTTTLLSALTAALVGVQAKVAWMKTSQKFAEAAHAFKNLEIEARHILLTVNDGQVNMEKYKAFIAEAKKVEMTVTVFSPKTDEIDVEKVETVTTLSDTPVLLKY